MDCFSAVSREELSFDIFEMIEKIYCWSSRIAKDGDRTQAWKMNINTAGIFSSVEWPSSNPELPSPICVVFMLKWIYCECCMI